jgi:SAM-dependent methyltransferase
MKWVKFIIKEFFGHLLIPMYFFGLFSTSSFLFFQWMLTLLRQRTSKFKNPPFFKERSIFSERGAKEIISGTGWKDNVRDIRRGGIDYRKLNEGLGGAYERVAYTNILKKLAKRYHVKKILELNSTYIAGVPAFNSSILAQSGYDLTVTVHTRDYRDALLAWKIAGLGKKIKIIKWDNDFKTPFRNGEFDLVWNHLAVEHYQDPVPLLSEMKRVTRKLVVTMTLSPFNLGFISHFLWHKAVGKPWDHGYIRNTLISTMEKYHRKVGLTLIESGGCDDPTSPDTVDSKMGESMTYLDALPKSISNKWVWTAINPACQKSLIVKLFWFLERGYPEWFRRLTAHHLYSASLKK